jgi:type IV secretory pathway VirB3-like protein
LIVVAVTEGKFLFGVPIEVYGVGCHVCGVVLLFLSYRECRGFLCGLGVSAVEK